MLVATMWVYDGVGHKVGEYEIPNFNEELDYSGALAEWCTENGLNAADHNQCVGRTEEI